MKFALYDISGKQVVVGSLEGKPCPALFSTLADAEMAASIMNELDTNMFDDVSVKELHLT